MIFAYNKCYDVNAEDFINCLGQLFNFKGLEKRGDEMWLRCPFHSHGEERTASASFKLTGENVCQFYCFGCKTKGHLSSILTKLFGSKEKAQLWLNETFKQIEKEDKRIVNKIVQEAPEIPQEFELPDSIFTNYTSYYESRGIPDDLVKKFRLGYSNKRNAVVLPVYDCDRKIIFYQVRYLDKTAKLKWFIPKGAKAEIFGADQITSKTVVICESVFNALTCWKFGIQAVAMFGARWDDSRFKLLKLPCLKFIIAFDGDEAGRKTSKLLASFLKENNRLVSVLYIDNKKDINDFAKLSKDDFMKNWESWLKKGKEVYG